MRRYAILLGLAVVQTAHANDWEKFYRPYAAVPETIPSAIDPEVIPSSGDAARDIGDMWRKGFAPIGFTSFNSPNSKTEDGVRLAKKLQARYMVFGTNLASSETVSIPLTLPNSTTSYTNGTVSANGSGGYANGNYSGTTTTYGSQTTYIPMTVNRFNKTALYFKEVPKVGTGIFSRAPTDQEVQTLETRHALVVRFVRDGSPADRADILPGDIITKLNDQPVDIEALRDATKSSEPLHLHLIRNGLPRDILLVIPPEWQRK